MSFSLDSNSYANDQIRKGMTLIELLVVIFITTLLATLLMYTIPLVRDASRQTVCAGNVRQIMVSELAYATNWKGFMQPMFSTSGGDYFPTFYWSTLMNSLVDDYGMNRVSFFCPNVAEKNASDILFGAAIWDVNGTYTQTHYSYIANPVLGPGNSTWHDFSTVPHRIFDKPADTVVISDLVFVPWSGSGTWTPGQFTANHLRNHRKRENMLFSPQTDRSQLRGANQGYLDGRVTFKQGTDFPAVLENRNVPGFNATVTHSWLYDWGFFF